MKKIAIGLAFAASLTSGQAGAETLISDIAYGTGDRNVLDLYLPGNTTNAPVVVYIHGGRWFRGDKTQVLDYDRVKSMTDAGMAVASIEYTHSVVETDDGAGGTTQTYNSWPTQLADLEDALRFVGSNGATYGYDDTRMAAWGQSSGGHMAAWAGILSATNPDIDLKGVVTWWAIADLYNLTHDRDNDAVVIGNERHPEASPESILIGKPETSTFAERELAGWKNLADAASPAVQIAGLTGGEQLPDFMIVHGTEDWVVSPLQAERLRDAVAGQAPGNEAILRLIEGGGHGDRGTDFFSGETAVSTAFLAERLGAAPVPVPGAASLLIAGFGLLGAMGARRKHS